MVTQDEISKAIFDAIDVVNQLLPPESRLKKSLDTPLFGGLSILDSLGLINFIVAVEKEMRDITGKSVSLTAEEIIALDHNPLDTIGTLIEYLYSKLKNTQ